jgi:hypothetical protein
MSYLEIEEKTRANIHTLKNLRDGLTRSRKSTTDLRERLPTFKKRRAKQGERLLLSTV